MRTGAAASPSYTSIASDPGPGFVTATSPQKLRGPIHGVLFDATGTLFDLSESVGTVYARMAKPHGVDLPAWRLDDAFRRIMSSAPPRVFPECPPTEVFELEKQWWRKVVRSTFLAADSTVVFDDAAAFFGSVFDYYEDAAAWTMRAGARSCLARLRELGVVTGVVSNFDQRLPIIMQATNIAEFLDTMMTPARCGAEKPDAQIFQAALAEIHLRPDQVVFIGDHPEKDRAAAREVGMQSSDPDDYATLADFAASIEQANREAAP